VPLDVEADVAWVGYANETLRAKVEPVLHAALARRGLVPGTQTSAEMARVGAGAGR
jgi:hypothetical protein